MAALRLLLVAVCLMFMFLHRVLAGEADGHAELKKCHTAQMVNTRLNYTTMTASPDQAIAAICHDEALREEAEAFACGARTLKKEVCNVPSMATLKVIFGGMAESRIETALRYGCDNVLALVRVARCTRIGYKQTQARKCGESPKIQKMTEARLEGTILSRADMCGALSAMTGCINRSVFTTCHAADLKVFRTLVTDIMPEGCISASAHTTANAAILILTAVVAKMGIW